MCVKEIVCGVCVGLCAYGWVGVVSVSGLCARVCSREGEMRER